MKLLAKIIFWFITAVICLATLGSCVEYWMDITKEQIIISLVGYAILGVWIGSAIYGEIGSGDRERR